MSEPDDLEVRGRELDQAVRTTVRRLAELEAGLAGGAGEGPDGDGSEVLLLRGRS